MLCRSFFESHVELAEVASAAAAIAGRGVASEGLAGHRNQTSATGERCSSLSTCCSQQCRRFWAPAELLLCRFLEHIGREIHSEIFGARCRCSERFKDAQICLSNTRADSQTCGMFFGATSDAEIWRKVLLRLLAKIRLPRVFKHLRPIPLQDASARILSRLMFARFGAFDERLDECSMGF